MPGLLTRRRREARGSALLLAIIIVVILGVIGLSIVSRASTESDAAGAKRLHDRTLTCADAARELLMSQFNAYGTTPTQLTLHSNVGDQTLSTGHYDNVNVTSVKASSSSSQAAFGVSDMSNRVAKVGMGGQVYRMTVVCSNGTRSDGTPARQSEVEYLVRFGL